MERFQGFDIARGTAVALVVLLHATLLPQNTVYLPQPLCRMALLLLISGTLAAPALTRPWRYSLSRAGDLLWLVLIWTPVTLLALKGGDWLQTLPLELIAPTSHLWYIGGLAVLVLSVPLLRHLHPAVPLSISAVASLWNVTGGRTGVAGYDQLSHFAIFFFCGLYGRSYLLAILARCGRRVGLAAAAVLVALLVLPMPHTAITMGSALMILLISQGLAGSRVGSVIAWLGQRTPAVYLGHVPVLVVSARWIGTIDVIVLAILTLGTIAFCLVVRQIADRNGLGWLYSRPTFALLKDRWMPAISNERRALR